MLPFCQNILVILTSFYSPSPKGCLSNVLVLRHKSELLYLRMSSLQNRPGKKALLIDFKIVMKNIRIRNLARFNQKNC